MITLAQLYELAWRFVPPVAVDRRLYEDNARSWWPWFGIDIDVTLSRLGAENSHDYDYDLSRLCQDPGTGPAIRYIITRELAATSISQRLLRRSGHVKLAAEEIQYTDEGTLGCSVESWCKRTVRTLLLTHKTARLPSSYEDLEALLARKAREVGSFPYASLYLAKKSSTHDRDREVSKALSP